MVVEGWLCVLDSSGGRGASNVRKRELQRYQQQILLTLLDFTPPHFPHPLLRRPAPLRLLRLLRLFTSPILSPTNLTRAAALLLLPQLLSSTQLSRPTDEGDSLVKLSSGGREERLSEKEKKRRHSLSRDGRGQENSCRAFLSRHKRPKLGVPKDPLVAGHFQVCAHFTRRFLSCLLPSFRICLRTDSGPGSEVATPSFSSMGPSHASLPLRFFQPPSTLPQLLFSRTADCLPPLPTSHPYTFPSFPQGTKQLDVRELFPFSVGRIAIFGKY